MNYRWYILFLLVPMILVCFVRNLRYLSPFSILATLAQSVGLALVYYYIFREPLPDSGLLPWVASWDRLPLFFGTAIFAIEGICVVSKRGRQCRYQSAFWHALLVDTANREPNAPSEGKTLEAPSNNGSN